MGSHQRKSAPAPAQKLTLPSRPTGHTPVTKTSAQTTKEALARYAISLAALEAILPTLPTFDTVITTVDPRRRGVMRQAIAEADRLAEAERIERRAIIRLELSKRGKADASRLTRKGTELSKQVTLLFERAEEIFNEGKGIPQSPAILTAHEERGIFKAFRSHRERFWTALHMVPFVRDRVIQELQEIRSGPLMISQVVSSPRSKGKTEDQLSRHVDANISTVVGMLGRERGKPGLLNSAKIATLLVEIPLAAERLTVMMNEVISRTQEMREIHTRLAKRHGSLVTAAVRSDPDYQLFLERSNDLGGPLKHAETVCRTLKALQEPYQRLKDYVVNANLRLVAKIACSRETSPDKSDELKQDGVLGLMRAIEKFDVDTGLKLSTVATWWIRQMVMRKRPLYNHQITLPPHRVNVLVKVAVADSEIKKVTDSQLGKKLKVDTDVIRSMRLQLRPMLSLSPRDAENRTLGDLLPDRREEPVLDGASQLELRERIQTMLRRIHPRLTDIINKRFGLKGSPMTLEQIARQMGITRERVRQLESRALRKIRSGPLAKMLSDFTSAPLD